MSGPQLTPFVAPDLGPVRGEHIAWANGPAQSLLWCNKTFTKEFLNKGTSGIHGAKHGFTGLLIIRLKRYGFFV